MTIEAQAVDQSSPSVAEVKGRYGYARKFIEENNVGIKHFRHTVHVPHGRLVNQFGGMTVAFQQKGSFVLIATAVCSDDDNYNSKLGTALATERLANNHAIVVPLLGVTALEAVNDLFAHMFEDFSVLEGLEAFGSFGDPEHFDELGDHPHPLSQLARFLSDGAEQFGAGQPAGLFEGQDSAYEEREAPAEPGVWDEHAKLLVSSLVGKLGGSPQDVLDGLKYLLEEADESEVVTVLAGTPAESFSGSSAVLAAVRQTAVNLLTGGPEGKPRLALVLRVRIPSPEEVAAAQEEGGQAEAVNPLVALGHSLADIVSKARDGAMGQFGDLEERIRSAGGLKQAFRAIPPADLLAALRNTPHAAAASAFLAKLQGPNRGDSGEDRG